jgi:hypothetical protein
LDEIPLEAGGPNPVDGPKGYPKAKNIGKLELSFARIDDGSRWDAEVVGRSCDVLDDEE